MKRSLFTTAFICISLIQVSVHGLPTGPKDLPELPVGGESNTETYVPADPYSGNEMPVVPEFETKESSPNTKNTNETEQETAENAAVEDKNCNEGMKSTISEEDHEGGQVNFDEDNKDTLDETDGSYEKSEEEHKETEGSQEKSIEDQNLFESSHHESDEKDSKEEDQPSDNEIFTETEVKPSSEASHNYERPSETFPVESTVTTEASTETLHVSSTSETNLNTSTTLASESTSASSSVAYSYSSRETQASSSETTETTSPTLTATDTSPAYETEAVVESNSTNSSVVNSVASRETQASHSESTKTALSILTATDTAPANETESPKNPSDGYVLEGVAVLMTDDCENCLPEDEEKSIVLGETDDNCAEEKEAEHPMKMNEKSIMDSHATNETQEVLESDYGNKMKNETFSLKEQTSKNQTKPGHSVLGETVDHHSSAPSSGSSLKIFLLAVPFFCLV